MPLQRCQREGVKGWRWGKSGKCFIGVGAKAKAERQGRAIAVRNTRIGCTCNFTTNRMQVVPSNPLKADPTRTKTLRRVLEAEFVRRFRELRQKVFDLVVTEDAFGLKRKPISNPFTGNEERENVELLSDGCVDSRVDSSSLHTPECLLLGQGDSLLRTDSETLSRAEEQDGKQITQNKELENALEQNDQTTGERKSVELEGADEIGGSGYRVAGSNESDNLPTGDAREDNVRTSGGPDESRDRGAYRGVAEPKSRRIHLTQNGERTDGPDGKTDARANDGGNVQGNEPRGQSEFSEAGRRDSEVVSSPDSNAGAEDRSLGREDRGVDESDYNDEEARGQTVLHNRQAHPTLEPAFNQRFAFRTTPEQLRLFQEWLATEIRQDIFGLPRVFTVDPFGVIAGAELERAYWTEFVRRGYEKGAGRAFSDVRKPALASGKEQLAFFEGTRAEFLRQSFAQPETVEKVKLLASRVFTDLKGVTDAMSAQMSRVLAEGLTQGKNPRAIAKDLVDRVDKIGITRARLIARTEIIRAHAEGQLDALERLGVEEVGVMVEWSTAGDDRVCPLCQPLEGVVFKLKEARGLIPRHAQCRCAHIPANVGEGTKGQKHGQSAVKAARDRSIKAEIPKRSKRTVAQQKARSTWAGADTRVVKKRPVSVLDDPTVEKVTPKAPAKPKPRPEVKRVKKKPIARQEPEKKRKTEKPTKKKSVAQTERERRIKAEEKLKESEKRAKEKEKQTKERQVRETEKRSKEREGLRKEELERSSKEEAKTKRLREQLAEQKKKRIEAQEKVKKLEKAKEKKRPGQEGVNRKKVEQSLKKAERELQSRTKEQLQVIDANGNVVGVFNGSQTSVKAPFEVKNQILEGNFTTVHNHPSIDGVASSFSTSDVNGGILLREVETRVVTQEGSKYSMRYADTIRNLPDKERLALSKQVPKEYDKIFLRRTKELAARGKREGMPFEKLKFEMEEVSHQAWVETSKLHKGLEYKKI